MTCKVAPPQSLLPPKRQSVAVARLSVGFPRDSQPTGAAENNQLNGCEISGDNRDDYRTEGRRVG